MDDPKTNQSTPDSFRRYCRNDFHWQTGFCIRHNLHDLRCCNRDRCCGHYYGQIVEMQRRETAMMFLDKLERLPELSKEDLEDISKRVQKFR